MTAALSASRSDPPRPLRRKMAEGAELILERAERKALPASYPVQSRASRCDTSRCL